jgi:hypothetical protein
VDDACQELALTLLKGRYLQGKTFAQAYQYIVIAAATRGLQNFRSGYRAQKFAAKYAALPQVAALESPDETLALFEIERFAMSLSRVHPMAPEYIARAMAGDADKEMIVEGFFCDDAVSLNYWHRYKQEIRRRLSDWC